MLQTERMADRLDQSDSCHCTAPPCDGTICGEASWPDSRAIKIVMMSQHKPAQLLPRALRREWMRV